MGSSRNDCWDLSSFSVNLEGTTSGRSATSMFADQISMRRVSANFTEGMQQFAILCAAEALNRYHVEGDVVSYIEEAYNDAYHGSGWRCMVGHSLGSLVTHADLAYFMSFYINSIPVVLYRA
ncbi:hypothetical protein MPTK1_8g05470 [Marchantia polymorpha subsp. ruderalis]|uniref:Dynein light chain n=2 Tax=Marchantia polymorpha TaxID=3197 RepID=A0A176VEL0_MARPO|nr:hypothetical protein AXG93_1783s1040 [Marchantia polymorpha subsp. ruderalis]PTQ34321.1 hypothetical protein MARPO_0081s0048 [Marchantia polymorpha]BBN18782.1 hypothetical protein Mp_8g05470 [Marchantia polymorpha subsp. ruderalis]|eukprot:PTQ34321.1 hypothetical protein MARPO_0081s0048 [Marchantia polymorpha]